MPGFNPNVVALVVVDTTNALCAADTLSARRTRLVDAAKACAMSVRRLFVDDVAAHCAGEASDMAFAACRFALAKGWSLIVDCDAAAAVLHKIQAEQLRAELYGARIEVYDLEALRNEQARLRAQSASAGRKSEKREAGAKAGRKRAQENGVRFGGPNLPKARRSSAVARERAFAIRRREYRAWRARAEAEGVREPRAFAAWLNARGLRTARGLTWTAVNARRVLNDLEMAEIVEMNAAIDAPPPNVRSPEARSKALKAEAASSAPIVDQDCTMEKLEEMENYLSRLEERSRSEDEKLLQAVDNDPELQKSLAELEDGCASADDNTLDVSVATPDDRDEAGKRRP